MSWHVDPAALGRYADGTAGLTAAASAEAHLTGCAQCRAAVAPAVDAPRLDAIWALVEHRVDVGTRSRSERALTRVGVGESTARLLAVTPSLRGAWLVSLAVAVVLSALAAGASPDGLVFFLTVAPMLPVAGVALAYGPAVDPAYELTVAAPYSMFRLALLRSLVVVGASVALTALGGLLLLDAGWSAAAWLLPALALSAATLALSTRVTPVRAAGVVGAVWLLGVLSVLRGSADDLAAFGPAGQLAALALLVAAGVAVARSRDGFGDDSRRSA